MSWTRAFDGPIQLPGGGELRTLRDAGNYIAKLPKREHDAPKWLAAMAALLLEVEHGETDADPLVARIAILQALAHGRAKQAVAPRKKAVKKYELVR